MESKALLNLRTTGPASGSIGRRIGFSLIALGLIFLSSLANRPQRVSLPRLVLWAWERPEDLQFIDPSTTAVAYLAATAEIQQNGAVQFHFRRQPLRVPKSTSLIAVVRIESLPRYAFANSDQLAASLAQIPEGDNVKELQIDYDARASERNFYRTLLTDLHRQTRVPIGITALASWCDGDQWLSDEPLSEAVPMFFRMGQNESKEMSVHTSACSDSIGLSTDEAWPRHRPKGLRSGARVYVFNPHSWTKAEYDLVVRKAKDWE